MLTIVKKEDNYCIVGNEPKFKFMNNWVSLWWNDCFKKCNIIFESDNQAIR